MAEYTNEFKMLAVRYYFTQADRSFEQMRDHFNIDLDVSAFAQWRKEYAREAVYYYYKHECTLSVVAKYFGVDHMQVVYWVKKYGKEIEKEVDTEKYAGPFKNDLEIKQLREELRNVREELAELRAAIQAIA